MSKIKVLIVDDNPTNLLVAQKTLRRLDVSCVLAKSGPEALEQIKNHEFAVIVLDIQMPEIDGFETARRLKANPATNKVPIIFLTAFQQTDANVLEGYASGAVDFLFKPIQPQVLEGKVRVFVELYRQQQIIAEQSKALEEKVAQLQAFTVSLARRDARVRMLMEARNALIESELQFRTLVNNIPGVSYRRLAEPEWRMHYVSEAVETLTGYPAAAFTKDPKTPFQSVVFPEDREAAIAAVDDALRIDQSYDIEYRILHADGSTRWVRDRGKGLVGESGKVRWIDGAMFDVTTDKERAEELRQAKEQAESANKAKSAFLANISHELRTPLHAILSFSDFGLKKLEKASKEKLESYFHQIKTNGSTLLRLLNELLDLAKLEAGKMVFDFGDNDLGIAVATVVDEFASHVSSRRISLRWTPPRPPMRTLLDPDRIKQVLRNLLSNAVKFSPEGGVIDILLEQRHDPVALRVTVKDQGPGIPEAELEAVFDEFVQSSKTSTGAGGTGLGLAICRQIITAHQGRIWAENNPDGGATFHFELPCEPAADVERVSSPADAVALEPTH
jgi:PAS domain S-box-containing protein